MGNVPQTQAGVECLSAGEINTELDTVHNIISGSPPFNQSNSRWPKGGETRVLKKPSLGEPRLLNEMDTRSPEPRLQNKTGRIDPVNSLPPGPVHGAGFGGRRPGAAVDARGQARPLRERGARGASKPVLHRGAATWPRPAPSPPGARRPRGSRGSIPRFPGLPGLRGRVRQPRWARASPSPSPSASPSPSPPGPGPPPTAAVAPGPRCPPTPAFPEPREAAGSPGLRVLKWRPTGPGRCPAGPGG
eukprot:XP_013967828.1 collagen alpha-1(I) chain-like [Canis lupus familiaris]